MRKIAFIYISLMVLGFLVSLSSEAEIAPESVIGIWLFEEDRGELEDSSDKGFNGVIYGDPEQVDGKFGNGLEFDGSKATLPLPTYGWV
jgi:hypothetical protein